MKTCKSARVGAAVFVAGLALSGPQAMGVAAADRGGDNSSRPSQSSEDTGESGSAPAGPRAAGVAAAVRGGGNPRRPSQASEVDGELGAPGSGASRRTTDRRSWSASPDAAAHTPTLADGGAELPAVTAVPRAARPAAASTGVDSGPAVQDPRADLPGPDRPVSPSATIAALDVPVAPAASAAVAAVPAASAASSCQCGILSGQPVRLAVLEVVTGLTFAVEQLMDSVGNWLTSLPANPVNDLLAGALWLVRRTLFPVGSDVGQWGKPECVSTGDCSGLDLTGANFGSGADLSGVNFTNAYLDEAVMPRANLTGAILSYARASNTLLAWADLTSARADHVDFTNANMSFVTMLNTDLSQSNLTGAQLILSTITLTDMEFSYLNNADLSGSRLDRVSLLGADLSGAITRAVLRWNEVVCPDGSKTNTGCSSRPPMNTSAVAQSIRGLSFAAQHLVDTLGNWLSGLPGGPLTDLLAGALWTVRRTLWPVGADVGQWGSAACVSSGDCSGQDLSGADLRRQDLAAVNFAGANLGDADLAGANLTGAVLNYVRGPGAWLVGADLSEVHAADAYFAGANLHRATMINTDLYQSDFTGAVLTRAEMTTANASFADFSDANLRGARLEQVNLWRADLTGADMRLVKWSDVTCPDGASSSTGCSGGPIMLGNQWVPTQPAAGFATRTNSWYEYRPVLRGTAGAPIQGQTEPVASYDDDGVMGMVKNYSGQPVLIQAPSLAPFGLSQALLEDGAEMPYMLFGTGELQFFPAVSGEVYSLQVNQRGYYYDPSNPPEVKLVGGGGTGATARAIMYDNDAEDETGRVIGGQVVGLEIITPGTGYTSAPTVVFEDGSGFGGAGASAQAFLGVPVSTVTKPAKLWLKDPAIGRPQSKFTPVGATDPVNERTGWREGESHHEIWGGTTLWVKRESDGWRVPASEAYLKMYGNPNTFGTADWAIFTIHIDKLDIDAI